MVVRVWRQAIAAEIGPVIVACDDLRVYDVVTQIGGEAVMTDPELPSGSDRVYQAAERVDAEGRFRFIVNLQGDLPCLDPALIRACVTPFLEGSDESTLPEIATLAFVTRDPAVFQNPNTVKIAGVDLHSTQKRLRALYFSRAPIPWGASVFYHHIGLYAYQRRALAAFVRCSPSPLESCERLEQLRALEAGMRIEVGIVEGHPPQEVNTEEDLAKLNRSHPESHSIKEEKCPTPCL